MNLILLSHSDLAADPKNAHITGHHLKHILEILKPKLNDTLTVGLENGLIGEGRIVKQGPDKIELEVSLKDQPPAKIPAVLCLALMRPPVFRRVLQTAAAMGVGELHFFHSRRVEKSFWQSTALRDQAVREELVLGLEQAKDTVFPEVHFHKRFKPFVEDVLPALLKDRTGIVADPSGELFLRGTETRDGDENVQRLRPPSPSTVSRPVHYLVIIGPEGGFIPFELEKFREAGCRIVSLGERILRVETAVVALLAKLF